jgi:hypothetical protein
LSGSQNKNEGIDKKMLTQTFLKYAPHATTERIDIAIAELLNDLNQNERDNLVTEGTKLIETNDSKQNFKDYLNNMNDAKLSKSGWCELMTAWLQVRINPTYYCLYIIVYVLHKIIYYQINFFGSITSGIRNKDII